VPQLFTPWRRGLAKLRGVDALQPDLRLSVLVQDRMVSASIFGF
jgi:hypothetical protein